MQRYTTSCFGILSALFPIRVPKKLTLVPSIYCHLSKKTFNRETLVISFISKEEASSAYKS